MHTYNGRTYSDPSDGKETKSTGSGGSGGGHGLSWRDPNTGTIYYNIDKPDSSYQTDRVNGGKIASDATYSPEKKYKASIYASLMPNAPTLDSLYSGIFDSNYLTGNLLALDPRLNYAQKAMITANSYAARNGRNPVYGADAINNASNGMVGWIYNQGQGAGGAYVQSHEAGGQNFISPTFKTTPLGDTYKYTGHANEPLLGAYALGTQTPQDMEYSWERTVNPDGSFSFNKEGADAARASLIPASITDIDAQLIQAGESPEDVALATPEQKQQALQAYRAQGVIF